MHLALRLISRRRCLNFINVRTAYASKIQASPTKNPLANSGTTRFREHIKQERRGVGNAWHKSLQDIRLRVGWRIR